MYISHSILIFILILTQIKWIFGFSKNLLFNQNERKFPTFLIDFELASVLCQHSNNPKDLHLNDISILCNGHQECFQSLFGQDDESFPHCRHLQCRGETKKEVDCNGKGACIFDGFTTRCFCNEGYYGLNCEYLGNKNEEKEAFDEFGLEFGKVLSNKYPNERKNWLKMKEIINEAKEANNKKQKEFGLLIGKGRMEMVGGGGHETSTKATSKSKANTETTELPNFEATSASSSETSTRGYNAYVTSILNLEATSASSFETNPKGYNTEASLLSTFEANSETTSIRNSEANTGAYTERSLEPSSAANTEANKLATSETISASDSETSPKGYNTEATSILNLETTSASNSIVYTEAYTEATSLPTSETNTEATKNSETSSILNLEASTKASREATSSSKIKTTLETVETTFSNFEPKSETSTEATISLNTQINPVATLTVTESKSNNEAILVDNEANFKSKMEEAETEAASLSTIPTGIEETSTKTEYASTKKFSINEANLSKQMKQNFPTSEAPNTENPNSASSLPSTVKMNSQAISLTNFEAKSTLANIGGLKMTTDNTEANYENRTTIKSVATTKETDNKDAIYLKTTMANVSPNSVIEVEATPGLELETASEANSFSVQTTSLTNIEATSNNEAKSVSNIETSSKANNEASSKGSIEATSIKYEVKDTKTSLKGNSLPSNTAITLSTIEASLSATDKIRSTSLTSKLESSFISTVNPSFSNFETTVPSATNSRLNSNKLITEATSESEARIKSSEFEAETKFPFEVEAKTKFPFEAEARMKSSEFEAETKFPFEAEAKLESPSKVETKMKSSKFEASTKSLIKPSKSEAESPSKTDSLVNTSTEATSITNNIKPEALTIVSTSFTPQISLNTRRNFETNFASNNTFSYTEPSQINNYETISATTLFSPTEATEPLISVSEANAYINNEATSKAKTEASPSLILVNSASSFKEATSILETEAGSTIANLASSASSFNEATSTKPTLSTTEANSIKNITDTSNGTSFKLINVSEASTMLPFETEIKLRFKSKARTKFFSKSEALTTFPSESEATEKVPSKFEARMKSSKPSTESVSTIESVTPTKFPFESVASTKSPSEPEAKKVPFTSEAKRKFSKSSTESASTTESVAPTKFPSEAGAETKSLSEYEANVKTTEFEAKMNSFETSTAEHKASTSFKSEAITKFPFEAEASTKSSTKALASTNIFKNIEVNSSKATKASTRSNKISFEKFLNKIGARKFSTEKPKLSSENSEINLLNTTPFAAITEANNNTNLINNEAASTKIIKTEAETNQNIETNTEPTLEAKFLVSKFEAKYEANAKSTSPIKFEATSEIYSKNVETITEAPLSLANTKNLGANVAATASDSVTNREFEQTTPLAGIEATSVANIVAASTSEASAEATSIASNLATSTVASNRAASEARMEAISTPEASIKATPVASNEATSLAKVGSTSASNIEARTITNTESTSLINSRTNVVSTSPVNETPLKPTPASLDRNTKENIEAKSVAFSTAKFVAENTEAANDATTSSTASSSFTRNIKQINSTLEANLKANEVKTKTEATSLNTEASFVASTLVANIETASTIVKTEANFNGTTTATESSEANFASSSGFISKATESSTASNVSASRFKINSEAKTVATSKTTLKTPRRFTKLQNCLQNWTRTTQNIETASITIKPIVEASSPSPNKITVSVEDSTVPLPSKNIRVVSPQNHTISPTTQNIETASSTIKPEASTKTLNKNIVASPTKITAVSVQDSTILFSSKISVVSPQTNTISPTTQNIETASTTIKPPIVEASSPNVSPNKTTVSGADSTVPLPSKNIRVVSHQNHTISPLKISSSVVSTNFEACIIIAVNRRFVAEISLNASSNSLKNLECFNNTEGKCGSRCENGYFLNSNGSCEDVDECKMGVDVCGKEAFCRNLEGAYRCECPKILKEDGHECAALSPKSIKEYIKVKCFRGENLENSSIQVVFISNVWKQFKGRVIVNGSQAENPKCFKDITRAILQSGSWI
uniref:EGF-like domain-containing protein n=1 Tax=Meloidogyne incognita TaxID=6306 RepID=A0A914L8I1_MELIC